MKRCDLLVTNASEVWSPPEPTHAPVRANTHGAGAVWGVAQGQANVISGGAVAILDGRIVDVGPAAAMASSWEADETLDAGGGCVTPALVDAHTHLVFAGDRAPEFSRRMRGGPRDPQEPLGITVTADATRGASDSELIGLVRARLDRALAGGAGLVEIKSGYALDVEGELRLLRVARAAAAEHPIEVVTTLLAAHALPEPYARRAEVYIDEVAVPATARASAEGLAEFADVFAEEGAFPPPIATSYLARARETGLGLRVHADQQSRGGGAALAASFGAASADHLEHTDAAGVAALGASGTVAVLLPGAVLTLEGRGGARPPARALIDAGVPVAIATDWNPGSSNAPSMALAVGLACRLFGLTPEEALNAATINGAASLGRGRETGRIAAGARADLCVWPMARAVDLAYELDAHRARHVVLDGRVVVREGRRVTHAVKPV